MTSLPALGSGVDVPSGLCAHEARDAARSLADRAYDELRERIATRRLVPGQRLSERSLALTLGMSATPVREALRRLGLEGLVVKQGTRTVVVAEHSPEMLEELQYAELVLRAALAKFAAGKATEAAVGALSETVDMLERCTVQGDPEEVLLAARRFDGLVEHIADSPMVTTLVRNAEVVQRSRRLQAVTVMLRHRHEVGLRHLAAHRELVDAIGAHDGDRAERVVRDHLRSSHDLLLSDLERSA